MLASELEDVQREGGEPAQGAGQESCREMTDATLHGAAG